MIYLYEIPCLIFFIICGIWIHVFGVFGDCGGGEDWARVFIICLRVDWRMATSSLPLQRASGTSPTGLLALVLPDSPPAVIQYCWWHHNYPREVGIDFAWTGGSKIREMGKGKMKLCFSRCSISKNRAPSFFPLFSFLEPLMKHSLDAKLSGGDCDVTTGFGSRGN